MKVLLYGYGNPGRQDDGLGIVFVNRMEDWVKENRLTGFEFENNYQLNIEDATEIADKDLVIFADASREEIDDFCITKVDKSSKISFTTHAASPGYIVKLCNDLFNKEPFVLLLHIRGYKWEFREGLTARAMANLDEAIKYMKKKLLYPEKLIGEFERLKKC